MSRAEAIQCLTERRNWLTERIIAKSKVQWQIEYDVRERDALTLILEELCAD